jgi:hypothetical protein
VTVSYDRPTALVVVDVQNPSPIPRAASTSAGRLARAAGDREIERALVAGALVVYSQD